MTVDFLKLGFRRVWTVELVAAGLKSAFTAEVSVNHRVAGDVSDSMLTGSSPSVSASS